MKEFALIFRMDILTKELQPSPELIQIYMKDWNNWMNSIIEKGKLSSGNHFLSNGRVLKPGNKSEEGPYVSDKISVAGYFIVKAANIDEAAKIARECPILQGENTSVEIRQIESM